MSPFAEEVKPDQQLSEAQPQPQDQPAGQAPEQVALPGRDGDKVESLLANSKALGIQTLATICQAAMGRLIESGSPDAAELFNDDERSQLVDTLAQINSTANLLGRSRIRLRQERAQQLRGARKFSEDPTDFSRFDEPGSLDPMAPIEAVNYFKRLVPAIAVDPHQFSKDANRSAFTMAVAAEQTLLDRSKTFLQQMLEAGQTGAKRENDQGAKTSSELLTEMMRATGVDPLHCQYSEMVVRTNLKDAYNVGADAERQHEDVIDTFPVWQYVGIRDGREGDDHRPKFDRYYPARATFAEVRGPRPFNCRCDSVPVDKWEWVTLQEGGAVVEHSW